VKGEGEKGRMGEGVKEGRRDGGRRAESEEQRAKSEEQRAKSKEHGVWGMRHGAGK
jgi:hypothetical protein